MEIQICMYACSADRIRLLVMKTHIKEHINVVRQRNMVMSPTGSGTRNDCAGESQQQFTRLTDGASSVFMGLEVLSFCAFSLSADKYLGRQTDRPVSGWMGG
jgi:hypothetical protein